VAAHCFLARILWLQGFPDQAMRSARTGIAAAQAIDHLVSLLYALVQTACPVALFAGDLAAADRFVTMLFDLSDRHAMPAWNVWGRCYQGVLLAERGDAATGSRLLGAALGELAETAFHMHYTFFTAELASAPGRAGEVAQGLAAIDRALVRCERNEEGWCLAELLRIKGELLLRDGARNAGAAAEDHFRRALDWACRQEVLSWELRAALSLARLRVSRHRQDDARPILTPVYDRFAEGFETADLRSARTMLEALPSRHIDFGRRDDDR
jgi:predicted ATPase